MALPTAIVMPRQAVYLAFMKSMRDPLSESRIADIIDQARGKGPADLVIKSVGIFDLTSGEMAVGDIAIAGDRIVGTYQTYSGATEIDGRGLIAVPGFIDSHVHCESTLVPPLEFDRCVVPRGTTTAICDPHEICNVLGVRGLKFFLKCAEVTVMDLRVQLSSCVPATHLETSGARLEAKDLLPFKTHPKVLGLAEMMNVPGVLNKDPGVLHKLAAFSDVQIDGHSPLLSSYDLNAYIAAGVRNCHETTSAAEAREKLAKGMQILIREGTVSKDLAALAELLTTERAPFLALCTDDRNPLDIAEEGHIDYLIRAAIGRGVRPLDAYRAATWSAARHFGLFDRGLVAPGQRADIVLLEDLATVKVHSVICRGAPVTPDRFRTRPDVALVGLDSVKLRPVTAETFHVPRGTGKSPPVIGIRPGNILTDRLAINVSSREGAFVADVGARHPEGGGAGPAQPPWQCRARLRPRLRHPARRHRLVGRPRQPQCLRHRLQRFRHGRGGQPVDRDQGRLRGGGRRQGDGRTGAARRRPDERPAVRGGRAGPAQAAVGGVGHGHDPARALPADGVPRPAGDPASAHHRQGAGRCR